MSIEEQLLNKIEEIKNYHKEVLTSVLLNIEANDKKHWLHGFLSLEGAKEIIMKELN
jgi:hypothetical protein